MVAFVFIEQQLLWSAIKKLTFLHHLLLWAFSWGALVQWFESYLFNCDTVINAAWDYRFVSCVVAQVAHPGVVPASPVIVGIQHQLLGFPSASLRQGEALPLGDFILWPHLASLFSQHLHCDKPWAQSGILLFLQSKWMLDAVIHHPGLFWVLYNWLFGSWSVNHCSCWF